jgi:hypothetical protein
MKLLGVKVPSCNLSTYRLRQEDQEFEDSLDYIARHVSKKKKQLCCKAL